ncbi:MAG: hypothetical protein JJU32_12980 [Phormidium sp. BM_Day4_Bin.17]|nr:hypothetical protein [Phormidium sp. BM_Day4_Bin.17]UCJ10441.1 MAG: hypothetical protein JWS08_11255 [Phormidium sp. PBR-2020]
MNRLKRLFGLGLLVVMLWTVDHPIALAEANSSHRPPVTPTLQLAKGNSDSKPPHTPVRSPKSGSCQCPYDTDKAGRSCGKRSAYSRPGGDSPRCYKDD